jgi:methylamine dehydrogenase accessory protein MauD
MLIASLFLLWMVVILLVVAVVALSRQVRAMQEGGGAVAPRAVVAVPGRAAPVVSAPTLAGDMLTIGGPSADGRAQLLLFIAPGCAASRSAVRDALALTNRTQLRLLFLGEGRAEDYADMLRQHRIRDTDIILNAQVGADFRIGTRPSAALIDAGGRLLARGAIDGRAQLEALLEHGQADGAVGQDADAKIVALAS